MRQGTDIPPSKERSAHEKIQSFDLVHHRFFAGGGGLYRLSGDRQSDPADPHGGRSGSDGGGKTFSGKSFRYHHQLLKT